MLVCSEVHAVQCTKTFKQAYFQTQSPMFRIDNVATYGDSELYLCLLFPVAVYMIQGSTHSAVINQQSFAHIHIMMHPLAETSLSGATTNMTGTIMYTSPVLRTSTHTFVVDSVYMLSHVKSVEQVIPVFLEQRRPRVWRVGDTSSGGQQRQHLQRCRQQDMCIPHLPTLPQRCTAGQR